MVRSFAAFASVAAAATLLSVADAHSNMVAPAPKWPEGFSNGNSPVGIVDSKAFTGAGKGIPGYQGVQKLTAELAGGDLRSFIASRVKMDMAGATKDCGKTLLTGTPYPLPAEVDFPWGHPGACAGYCDDVQFFKDNDCMGNKIGKIKVDQGKCAGAKRLQVMYLGVHVEDYQYYVNCVPIGAGGGGGGGGASAGGNGGGNSGGDSPSPAPGGNNNNNNNNGNNNNNNGNNNNNNNGNNNNGNNNNNNGNNNNNNNGNNNSNNGNNNNNNNGNNNNNNGNNNNNNNNDNNNNNNGNNNNNNNNDNNNNNNNNNGNNNNGNNNNNNNNDNNNNDNYKNNNNNNQNNRNNNQGRGGQRNNGRREWGFPDLQKRSLRAQ